MRADPASPDTLVRDHPEWRPWLALLGEARQALSDPQWARASLAGLGPSADASAAPLLEGAMLAVDGPGADRFVRRLFDVAAIPGPTPSLRAAAQDARLDAPALLEAAVCQDASRLEDWASRLGVPGSVFRAVAAVAAIPLLHACRATRPEPPPGWSRGDCPVCGAWATLAEVRGLERSRQLRCARCGSDWRTDWLRCPYCGNADHATLGSLVPEAVMPVRSVATCDVCHGYVKTLTTLQATPAADVGLVDLATVALDIAAIEHGYARPDEPAHRLSARVVAATRP